MFMATIIETTLSERRIIKLSTDDIISVVREYQRIISTKQKNYLNTRNVLDNNTIYIPEDI